MIASLRGQIIARDQRTLVVEVAGVGYRVAVTTALLDQGEGATITLFTSLHVTGETIDLYGFSSPDELRLFQSLLKVSGVGPRSALTLLSGAPADELRTAIVNGEIGTLTRVPGIGKKTAERIILELSGTLAKSGAPASDEAVDALERLGYTRREAAEALRTAPAGDVRDRIRVALQRLSDHRP